MSEIRIIDIDLTAAMFKAVSNPQRLRSFLMFCRYAAPNACDVTEEGMACCVGDIGGDLGLAPSTVSHHIKELRQAGLVQVERRGQRIECRVSDEVLQLLASFFIRAREVEADK